MVNIPVFAGFYTSQMVQDFFHQQFCRTFQCHPYFFSKWSCWSSANWPCSLVIIWYHLPLLHGMGLVKFLIHYAPANYCNISIEIGNFADDVSFPQVGYVFLPTRVPPTPKNNTTWSTNSYDVAVNTTEKRPPFQTLRPSRFQLSFFKEGLSVYQYTPWKVNMEPKHGGLEKMMFLFNWVMF